jgi:hypothetical protein
MELVRLYCIVLCCTEWQGYRESIFRCFGIKHRISPNMRRLPNSQMRNRKRKPFLRKYNVSFNTESHKQKEEKLCY